MANRANGDLPDPTGRNADKKYYRSGQVSAIQQSRVDSGKGTNIPVPNFRSDDRSTNKYYKEGGTGGQQILPGEVAAQRELRRARQMQPPKVAQPLTAPPPIDPAVSKFKILKAEDVRPVCEAVINHLLDPSTADVTIQVVGKDNLPMRVRTYLDLQVSRERITESQYRDISIKLCADGEAVARTPDTVVETRTPDEIFGNPAEAAPTTTEAAEEEIGNIGDFLAKELPDDAGDFLAEPQGVDQVVVKDGTTDETMATLSADELKDTEVVSDFLSQAAQADGPVDHVFADQKPLAGVPAQPKKEKRKNR